MSTISQVLAESVPKYNSRLTQLKGGQLYTTQFTPESGEVMVMDIPDDPLVLMYSDGFNGGRRGNISFDRDRVELYNSITPIYVTGLGAINALDVMNAVVDIDRKEGIDPVYPTVNNYTDSDIAVFNSQLKTIVGDKPDVKFLEAGPITALVITFNDAVVVIKINWLLNTVSVEHTDYTVAHAFAGDIGIAGSLKKALEIITVLYRMVRINTRVGVAFNVKSKVQRTLESYIVTSTSLDISSQIN